MDLFVAVTNDDEDNIMSCLLAKRMGARRVVALINRRSYVDLLQAGQIDIAISPAQATIGNAARARAARPRYPGTQLCAAAWPRRSRPWCTGIATRAAWSAGKSRKSTCPGVLQSQQSCAATR